jgi:hypothetical protein
MSNDQRSVSDPTFTFVQSLDEEGVLQMRCQHVEGDLQCRFDATRRVLVVGGDPPDPDQAGFAGTIYVVQVCKEHDPDPRQSMPIPRPPGSVPIAQRHRV